MWRSGAWATWVYKKGLLKKSDVEITYYMYSFFFFNRVLVFWVFWLLLGLLGYLGVAGGFVAFGEKRC